MKISTKGRYGTRALLELALHQEEKPMLLKNIARRQQISLQYLDRLISPLVTNGMIRSIRGAKGGVKLARPPEQIKLSEVIQLLEGSTAPVECINNPGICERSESCVTRELWEKIKNAMDEVLESTTLQDLVESHREKEKHNEAMYYI